MEILEKPKEYGAKSVVDEIVSVIEDKILHCQAYLVCYRKYGKHGNTHRDQWHQRQQRGVGHGSRILQTVIGHET